MNEMKQAVKEVKELNEKDEAFRCNMCDVCAYFRTCQESPRKGQYYCDSNAHKRSRGISEEKMNSIEGVVWLSQEAQPKYKLPNSAKIWYKTCVYFRKKGKP